MKIGFTGTREGMTIDQARKLWLFLSRNNPSEFHHGDCIGADEAAHYIAKSLGAYVIGHPPANPKKRAYCECDELRPEQPFLVRNKEIVNESEVMAACPKSDVNEHWSGTWQTIRYAAKLGTPTEIIYPALLVDSSAEHLPSQQANQHK